ncbi:hypothetical protein, variant 2 [Aphanomyces invadans]|uniref:Uncharacterized protein n=1 Tax=Aphanomyces invadans TaxID=157072 RepID=A0A024TX91_9STRA|nr:hypothetical protein, variant 1 [Aphanomyces invadans]XP_008872208.1 hypothetical protein, variant 2 [Aphanomyces invadans]ETV98779.1 hypothetical protein, variant 1 [Aphanomyces invadans]ETV98780.1 hypothetical protein, variant 2 [Aphanomyces invadans]|eukprot:XP_008872206.1 hypothetical protein, variant 1 [Aphanomyces invadans]
MAMAPMEGGIVPMHVQIFQGLVPQVASQATSLENILRTLCQKIETLEACLTSINSGVVEMDMRLKTIAHNIEGGTNDDGFGAMSTFMPPLVTEKAQAKQPAKSAVVSHVISALAMGHIAKPLERLKKKRKKATLQTPPVDVAGYGAGLASGAPVLTDKPIATLNRGHSSARLLRDSPRSRSIPEQREMPHSARSKSIVRSLAFEQHAEGVAAPLVPNTVPSTPVTEEVPKESEHEVDEPVVLVHADPWDMGDPPAATTGPRPTDASKESTDGLASASSNGASTVLVAAHVKHDVAVANASSIQAPATPKLSVEVTGPRYVQPKQGTTDVVEAHVLQPTQLVPSSRSESTRALAADACIEPRSSPRRRSSPLETPPPKAIEESVRIPRLSLSRLHVERLTPLQTPVTPLEPQPLVEPAATPSSNAAKDSPQHRETIATSHQVALRSSVPGARPASMTRKKTMKILQRSALSKSQPTQSSTSPASPPSSQQHYTLVEKLDASQTTTTPPAVEGGSLSESSDSVDDDEDVDEKQIGPSEEDVQRLKQAGQHGWHVVRTKLATLKRPKNILFTKKKQLFTIANRLELLERKSKELFAGEKQLALLLAKKVEDILATVMAAVEVKVKDVHRDLGKAVDDKADSHVVLAFSHRIQALEQAVRAANADFIDRLSVMATQSEVDRKVNMNHATAQSWHDTMQAELREQAALLTDHATRVRMLDETLSKSNQDMASQFKDLLEQWQSTRAAQDDMRRQLRKKADAKMLKELEVTMFKGHEPKENESCAARCMSCRKDIVEPATPEHDPDALHRDVVHNSLTKKVNIGQFATKVDPTRRALWVDPGGRCIAARSR